MCAHCARPRSWPPSAPEQVRLHDVRQTLTLASLKHERGGEDATRSGADLTEQPYEVLISHIRIHPEQACMDNGETGQDHQTRQRQNTATPSLNERNTRKQVDCADSQRARQNTQERSRETGQVSTHTINIAQKSAANNFQAEKSSRPNIVDQTDAQSTRSVTIGVGALRELLSASKANEP